MRPDDLPFPNSPVIPTRDAQFSRIEKRVHRIHRWVAIGATIGSIIALTLLSGGCYVVYLLLGHFEVI